MTSSVEAIEKLFFDEMSGKRLYLFDMDGTLYKDNCLFPGVKELLKLIDGMGGKFVFITNNSSKSINDYIHKLKGLGITADEDNFFTSTQASIFYIKKKYPSQLIYCQGTKAFIKELADNNLRLTTDIDEEAKVVLVGYDTELNYEKLRKTCDMLHRDVSFLATNMDFTCPVTFGFVPDCGSICEMFTRATGKKALFLGKPNPIMVHYVREKFSCTPEETVVIGDRLYTDIALGLNAGVTSICVLSGEATLHEIEFSEWKPHYVFSEVGEIYSILSGLKLE